IKRWLSPPPQEIDFHLFQYEPERAGGIAIESPDDIRDLSFFEHPRFNLAAFALDSLAGEM
ncbi:MAG: hypothetical protein VYB45_09360, partial [Pseudomonadota bacterium]|nr:hypothetical protein [Pseudomonadota bacterium]